MNKKMVIALGMAAVMSVTAGGATFVYAEEEERPAYVHDESEVTGTITVYTTMEQTSRKFWKNCGVNIIRTVIWKSRQIP